MGMYRETTVGLGVLLISASLATAGYVIWSRTEFDAPVRQVPGTLYKIASTVTGDVPMKVVTHFEFVGTGSPTSARLTVLVGNSQGKVVLREIGNPEIFASGKGDVTATFADGQPAGSRLFLAEGNNDLKAPIVCISNIVDLRPSKKRDGHIRESPQHDSTSASVAQLPRVRVWTGRNGKTITATLEREVGGAVYLRKPDGSSIKTQRATLSPADVVYLESMR